MCLFSEDNIGLSKPTGIQWGRRNGPSTYNSTTPRSHILRVGYSRFIQSRSAARGCGPRFPQGLATCFSMGGDGKGMEKEEMEKRRIKGCFVRIDFLFSPFCLMIFHCSRWRLVLWVGFYSNQDLVQLIHAVFIVDLQRAAPYV